MLISILDCLSRAYNDYFLGTVEINSTTRFLISFFSLSEQIDLFPDPRVLLAGTFGCSVSKGVLIRRPYGLVDIFAIPFLSTPPFAFFSPKYSPLRSLLDTPAAPSFLRLQRQSTIQVMPAERSKPLKRSDSTGVIISAVSYFQNHIDTSAPTGNQFVWASQPEPTNTFMDISFTDNMSYSSFSDDMPPLVCAPPQTEFVMFPPPSEAGSPRKQPHSKKKPENHIPRPPNAFILFRSSFIKSQHVSTAIETNHSTLSKIIGLTWQSLPEEERQVWHLKAKQALDEHKRKFPKYAFRPMQTKSKGAASEKRKVREVEPKDMKRCTKIAQLLVEGKKGDELDAAIHEFDKHHVPEIVTRFEAPITERAFRRSSSAPIPDTERSKKGQSFLQHVASSPRKPRSSSTRPSRCSTPADGIQHAFSFNEHVHSPTPMFKEEQSLFVSLFYIIETIFDHALLVFRRFLIQQRSDACFKLRFGPAFSSGN